MEQFSHTWEESVLWLRENNVDLSQLCYYDDPIEIAAERFYSSEEWKEVEKILKNKIPGTVLDVGAGRGISSYAFSKTSSTIYALEPNKSKVVGQGCIEELNLKTNSKIQIVSNLSELETRNIKFDIVYCRAALHHIPDLENFFRIIYKLLNQGGLFLATREHIIKDSLDKEVFLKDHALHKRYGGENAFTVNEYITSIQNHNLKLIKVFYQYDSVINYFPMAEVDYNIDIVSFRQRRKWKYTPNFLLKKISILKSLFMKSLNSFYYFPGTHCSFLAIKK